MAKVTAPRRGSLAFSPRKKAKKQYFSARSWQAHEGKMLMGFAGYKAGMTHIHAIDKQKNSPSFEQKVILPATIIECPPLMVFGVRAYKKTTAGLRCIGQETAAKPAKNLSRKITAPKKPSEKTIDASTASQIRLLVHTQPTFKKTPEIFEIPVSGTSDEAYKYAKEMLGKEIAVADVFEAGMLVDVIGVTKGKGMQGPVKRWGTRIQYRKAHGKRRHVGSINPWTPTRIMWTSLMAGQKGYQRRTESNKMVLVVGSDGKEVTPKGGIPHYGNMKSNYIIIKGSVPGPKKRALMIRFGVRTPTKERAMPEVQSVSTLSQQGRAR
ncbi:MAG: 50S ribosomal protein L3 [Candidatus Diapherotrites archaeon]|nr:50S ribosomal protein L3 [Candidatus Diapherotrites archaeon]